MSGLDCFDPFVLFCGVEAIAVFALLVVGFGLSVNCAHVAMQGYVTPAVAHLQLGVPDDSEPVDAIAPLTDDPIDTLVEL